MTDDFTPSQAKLDAAFGVHRAVAYDPAHPGPWTVVYEYGAMVIGPIVFAVVLFRVWRAFIRALGPTAGLIMGVVPSLGVAFALGVVGAFLWPAFVFAPIVVAAARKPLTVH